MSMPSFPKNGADMTREEALTMIIACLAMEELALSHILNAGGEHLQFVLGTLPGTSSKDVLAVHKSITGLVEAVTQNQLLLKKKLDQVLEFCPRPSEPDPAPQTGPRPDAPGLSGGTQPKAAVLSILSDLPVLPGASRFPVLSAALQCSLAPAPSRPSRSSKASCAAVQKKCPSSDGPAGKNAVGAGLPPVLETPGVFGTGHLLGRTHPWPDTAESRKNLCGPVHIERLRSIPGGGNGPDLSPAVALRRVCRCAAPVFFAGKSASSPSDPSACLCAASPHEQRVSGRTVPGAERQNSAVCQPGRAGHRGALAEVSGGEGIWK